MLMYASVYVGIYYGRNKYSIRLYIHSVIQAFKNIPREYSDTVYIQ